MTDFTETVKKKHEPSKKIKAIKITVYWGMILPIVIAPLFDHSLAFLLIGGIPMVAMAIILTGAIVTNTDPGDI